MYISMLKFEPLLGLHYRSDGYNFNNLESALFVVDCLEISQVGALLFLKRRYLNISPVYFYVTLSTPLWGIAAVVMILTI